MQIYTLIERGGITLIKFKKIILAGVIFGSDLGIIPLQTHATQGTNGSEHIQQVTSYGDNTPGLGIDKQTSTITKWKMTVFTDTLGIAPKVNDVLQNTVFQNITRELTNSTFSIANNRYNVIMFTSHSNYEYQFLGEKFHATVNFRGNQYDLYVFESGKFYKDNPNPEKTWAWGYKGWAINSSTSTPFIQFYLP